MATQCCERDDDHDGNCPLHPEPEMVVFKARSVGFSVGSHDMPYRPVNIFEIKEVRKRCEPTKDGTGNVILTIDALNWLLQERANVDFILSGKTKMSAL